MKDKAIDKNMISKTKRSIKWTIDEKNNSKHSGIHLIAEFWGGRIIETKQEIEKILIEAVKKANCMPLNTVIHKFEPQGITGVVLLAESHITIHSWPEYDYVAIDIFTCGDRAVPDKALEYLKKVFNPEKIQIQKVVRGSVQ